MVLYSTALFQQGVKSKEPFIGRVSVLGYHRKSGHTLSVQNRPTRLAEDVIVVPCCDVGLQGLGLSAGSGIWYCGLALRGSRLAE
jgi:hypothetical protein